MSATSTSTSTRSGPTKKASFGSTSARCCPSCDAGLVSAAASSGTRVEVPQRRRSLTMGVFEEAKGKVKEAVGDLTDNPDLHREGQAQKDKGEAQREATQARAE